MNDDGESNDLYICWYIVSLIKDNKPFKKLEFKVSNESAWEIGLACGGEIAVYLEQFN